MVRFHEYLGTMYQGEVIVRCVLYGWLRMRWKLGSILRREITRDFKTGLATA